MDVGNTKDVEQQDATIHLTAEKKGRFIVKNIKSSDEKQQTPDQIDLISHDEKNFIKTNDSTISNVPTRPMDEKSIEKQLSTTKIIEEKQVEKEKVIYDDRMVEKSTEDVSLDRAKAPKKSRFTIKTVPKDDEKERAESTIPLSTTNIASNKNAGATQPYFPSEQNSQIFIVSQPSTDQNHFTCLATQNSLSDSNLNNMGNTTSVATATHHNNINSEAHQLLVPIDQIKHILEMNSQIITQLSGALSTSCSSICLKCGYVGVNGAENPSIYRTITPGSMSNLSHQDIISSTTNVVSSSSKSLQPVVTDLHSASNTDTLSTTTASATPLPATSRPESRLTESTSTVTSNLPSSSSTTTTSTATATVASQKSIHLNTTVNLDRNTAIMTTSSSTSTTTALTSSSSVSNLHTLSTITLPSTTPSSLLNSNTKENSFPKINHLLSEVTKELKVAEKRIKDYQLEQKTLREKCQQLEDHVALEQSKSIALEEQLTKAHSKIKSLQAKQDFINSHDMTSSNNSIISGNNTTTINNNIKQQQQQLHTNGGISIQTSLPPLIPSPHHPPHPHPSSSSSSPVDPMISLLPPSTTTSTTATTSIATSTATNMTLGNNNSNNSNNNSNNGNNYGNNSNNIFGNGNNNIHNHNHNQNTNIHTVNNSTNNMINNNNNTNNNTNNNIAGGNGLIATIPPSNIISNNISNNNNNNNNHHHHPGHRGDSTTTNNNNSNHPSLLSLSNHNSPPPLGIISMHPSEHLDRMDSSNSSNTSNIINNNNHNNNSHNNHNNATLLTLNAVTVNATASTSTAANRSLAASMMQSSNGGGGGGLSQPCVSPGPGSAHSSTVSSTATGPASTVPASGTTTSTLTAVLGAGTAPPLTTPVVTVTTSDATPLDELGSIAARDSWSDNDITPILQQQQQQQQQQTHLVMGLNSHNGLSNNYNNMTSGFH